MHLEVVGDPQGSRIAEPRVGSREIQQALPALRIIDVEHRAEGGAHEKMQPLPLWLEKHPDRHVVRDFVRGRTGRQ